MSLTEEEIETAVRLRLPTGGVTSSRETGATVSSAEEFEESDELLQSSSLKLLLLAGLLSKKK